MYYISKKMKILCLKRKFYSPFFYVAFFFISAQEITGKIIDFEFKKPIENVAIQTSKETGTISNKEGNYSISVKNITYITFSKLGFETKTISLQELKSLNFVVILKEKSTLLKGFQLHIAKISLDSLLLKTQRSMLKNYISSPTKSKFYVSENAVYNFKNVALNFKSSSLLDRKKEKLAKKELQNFANEIKNSQPDIPKIFMGNLETIHIYSEKAKKSFLQNKTDSVLGFKPLDSAKTFSLEKLQNQTKQLILKYLDKNKTYKVKTGIFKVEDSVAFGKSEILKDSSKLKNSFTAYKPFGYMETVFKKATFFKNEDKDNFLSSKYYQHKLLASEFLHENNHYVISFKPRKSKVKYQGKMYINPTDFTISKVSYQFAKGKRGEHINLKFLLGVKHSENKQNGTLYYQKNSKNQYYLAYFKETIGAYSYASRPFKFIENSTEKNKIKFSVKLEFNVDEITEVFLSNFEFKKDNKFSTPMTKDFFKKNLFYQNNYNSTKILQDRQQELANFLNEIQ